MNKLVVGLGSVIGATFVLSTLVPNRANAQGGEPVVIANARQYELTSRSNGQIYRVWISTPVPYDSAVAYPVLYLLDGNITSYPAAIRPPGPAPAIVVGIGYPTDDLEEFGRRRLFDLTPSVSDGSGVPWPAGARTGGSDSFLRLIEEQVKPFVSARYLVDSAKQTLFGYSLGGLTALRVLFRNPTSFSAYILASPSIWYNGREVLADEDAFSKRARTGELHIRILVTSAGEEQYRGDDQKRLAESNVTRMIDNASELAGRLATLNPANITVARTIFDGETHTSVMLASLSRAIQFALPPQ